MIVRDCREDKRNKNGGAWTFRVPKSQSHEFWKEVLMMAIGEILQEVVEKGMFSLCLSLSVCVCMCARVFAAQMVMAE